MDGKKRVLAIDLGASSGRGILFTSDGRSITYREMHRFANNAVDRDGALVWDMDMLTANVVECIRACAKSGIHIDSIGIDTWGVDYGIIGEDGSLKGAPYCYRDERTLGATTREDVISRRELFSIAGISLNEFNTSYQLMAETREIGASDKILFIPYLLAYYLTGVMAQDETFASTTGFFADGEYSEKFLDIVGLSANNFAPTKKIGEVIGKVRREILDEVDIDYDIDVRVAPGHDTASAIMTVMGEEEYPLYLSSGTWSLFGTLTDEPIINDTTYREGYTNERGFGGMVTLLKNIMGMWIVQECKREWDKTSRLSWQDIQDKARDAQPFAGLINVGDSLFNAPHGMDERIVEYVERTQDRHIQGVSAIARCVYDSLAMEYRYALEGLERITGKKYSTLYIIGGGVQNDLLNSLVADALGVRVVAGAPEATAIGNALAQLYGIGVITSGSEMHRLAKQCYREKEYFPTRDSELWTKEYARYIALKR